ncbi:unnamed protein product [Staurois parvus]|uniref:Uncharacterized protein n=1 Tax=Staurois parvus TaxID=386267 RepID=A0ABN9E4I4_9NEOB|nr:unnamed protein product [Staurois parvus]
MGPLGNRGSWGPLCPCPNSKKPMKKCCHLSHAPHPGGVFKQSCRHTLLSHGSLVVTIRKLAGAGAD